MLHKNTITIFNFHKGTGLWYPSVVDGVHVEESDGASSTTQAGKTNNDGLWVSMPSSAAKLVKTSAGEKAFVSPKAYAACTDPANCLTLSPEQDFIYCGEWETTAPIADDECGDDGLYSALNELHDGVYMITSATYCGLIPHFEIGGR